MAPAVSAKRSVGRPRLTEPKSSVSTWIWAKHHDRLIQMARQRETSVSTLVKDILTKAIDRK